MMYASVVRVRLTGCLRSEPLSTLLSTMACPIGSRDNCMMTFAPAGARARPLMSNRRRSLTSESANSENRLRHPSLHLDPLSFDDAIVPAPTLGPLGGVASRLVAREGTLAVANQHVRREKVRRPTSMKAQESLYTDRYELSMLDGALRSGVIDATATFEVFTRSLPNGYRYGVVAGTGRLLDALAEFSFDDETISWLLAQRVISTELATLLASYRFEGTVYGYSEGEVFTSLSPILRIEGRFCDLVLETLALSILHELRLKRRDQSRPRRVGGSRTPPDRNGLTSNQ